ncbi:hypothetical protein ACQ4M4_18780 [Leptolyngbya sp. AN02str]|uniref:hypothetical protein n=1 Tax=Leptolyngbya sp. AN02str TaxID=3423363 RepID=UPI003D320C72
MSANTYPVTVAPASTNKSTSGDLVSHLDAIIGAAIFDLSGLPQDYFTTSKSSDISWVQTIFQALGLQSLLVSSLRLEGFRLAVIHGKDCHAVVIRQRVRYVALLLEQSNLNYRSDNFIQWLHEFEPETLQSGDQFESA